MTSSSGRVTTFYSYKGGVGRTMALANVAWLLANTGRRVLVIDWDLEAPGLHRYFYPFLEDPGLEISDGLLDLLWSYVSIMQTPAEERSPPEASPQSLADFSNSAVAVNYSFPSTACLHLVGAGRQDESYSDRLYRFDWRAFYERFGGAEFVDRLIAQARTDYDIVLVDSRTGVADTSGICTLQIPDQVVLCFTYNRQSVEGTRAIARAIGDRRPDCRLLLRPTRVVREVEGISEAREFARDLLGSFLPADDRHDAEAYWQRVEIPHYSTYAFEEILAAVRDVAGGRNTLLADMELLASDLAGGVPIRAQKLDKDIRERLLRRFRLRDQRLAALEEAMKLDTDSCHRRLVELIADARRHYGRDGEWLAKLAERADEVGDRLVAISRHEDAAGIAAEAVNLYRAAASGGSEGSEALPRSLVILGLRLTDLGRRKEALDATTEAVDTYRELAKERPDAVLNELAGSLNNLGMMLSNLGRREEALDATTESVDITRKLAGERPDAFLPDLAGALSNLAIRFADLGRREEALDAANQAVDIRRRLARERPDAFLSDLAGALNNLGNMLANLGRRDEALAATNEAVDSYRKLARERPDAFLPELAGALSNLGNRLADLGRHEAALDATVEAVDNYRKLARERPDTFLPDLAGALSNLGIRLVHLGHLEQARDATTEAVDTYRKLAKERPDAVLHTFAGALGNLGMMFSNLGDREQALDATNEAVDTYRQLAKERPDTFLPDLAGVLNNLGKMLADLGRSKAALDAIDEAVDIRRKFAEERPDAFLPELALSLAARGQILDAEGRVQEALVSVGEAIQALRPTFLAHPQAVAHWMGPMCQEYLARCEKLGTEPDADLLGPIAETFNRMSPEAPTE